MSSNTPVPVVKPKSNPYGIQVKIMVDANGKVHTQIVAPTVCTAIEIGEMLEVAARMCRPVILSRDREADAAQDKRVVEVLRRIGATTDIDPSKRLN